MLNINLKRLLFAITMLFLTMASSAQLVYCTQSGTTATINGITNVTFNTINSNSTKTAGYANYSGAISTIVVPSTTYNLSVSLSAAASTVVYARVWIDWNGNGSFFDPGEQYDLGSAISTSSGVTTLSPLSITVPAGAVLGKTIIRVAAQNGTYPTICQTGFDGEVLDYGLVISNCPYVFSTSVTPLNPIVCNGSSATLTASSGASYNWSVGQTTSSITVTPTANTVYTVTTTDANGCTATASSQISVAGVATINPSTPIICQGSSTTLTAGGLGSFRWNNGDTLATNTVAPTANTIYSVTATYSGCSGSASALVTVEAVPTVSVSPTTASICPGGSVTLTASGTAVSYLWSNGLTTSSVTANPGSTSVYSVIGTGNTGCTTGASATVTVNAIPAISMLTSGTGYLCNSGADTLTASGGTSYLWSTGANTAAIITHPTVTTNYTVTATNSYGCTASYTGQVPVYGTVTVSPSSVTSCPGNQVTLTVNGGSTYSWSTGQATQSIVVAPTATTTYKVTATNTHSCPGVDSAAVTVTVNATPAISVTTNPASGVSCSGGAVTLSASGGSTYAWSTGATSSAISVTPVNSTTYVVTGTLNGCPGVATSTVTVYGHAVITQNYTTICSGSYDSLTAQVGTGAHYLWSTGDTTSTILKNPSVATTYTVTVTPPSSSGCLTSSASATVNVNTSPTAGISPPSLGICLGSVGTLTGTGGTSYAWSSGDHTATINKSPGVSTTYTVTVTNGSGCTASASALLTVNSIPALPTTTGASRCGAGSVTLTASGALTNESYRWYTAVTGGTLVQNGGATYTTPSLTANVTYYVSKYNTVTGCEGSRWYVTAEIFNGAPPVPVVYPATNVSCTGFTANWAATTTSSVLDYRLDVASDSGFSNILSSWNNINVGFTGSEAVSGLSSGTYYYRLRAENVCGVSVSSTYVATTTASSATPVSAAATNVGCSSFTANWAAAAGASSYLIDVSTSSSFTSFISGYNGVNVGNATSTTIAGLTLGTTYFYRVRSTNGCFISSNSATQNVTTTSQGSCYCSQYGSASALAAITNVTFNTLTYTNLTRSAGYVDFSGSLSTTVLPSSTYSLSVSANTGGVNTVYAKVWIDWNENGVFDSTEQYLLGTASSVTNGVTSLSPLSVTVPAGAVIGNTLMRVEVKAGAYGSPCDTGINGQVEDYRVIVSNCSSLPTITITPTSTAVCSGQSATLTAGGGLKYAWNTGDTSTVITKTPASTTTYTVTGTNSTGCSATASATVIVDGAVTATLTGGSTPVCYNTSPGTLTVTAAGGSGSYTYQWYNGAGAISGATASTYAPGLLTASNSYYCVATATSCGSATSATKAIAVYSNLSTAISGGNSPICYNTSPGTLTATATGGTGTYTYNWYSSGGFVGITTSTYAPGALTASNSYYCAITSGSCGTVNTSTKAVTVYGQITASISGGTSPVCSGGSGGTLTVTAAGGSGSYAYQWYNSSGAISGATSANYVASGLTATSTYYCIVNSGGCAPVQSTTSIIIAVNANPSTSPVGVPTYICAGQSTTVQANALVGSGSLSSYAWSNGGSGSSITVSPLATTSYTVTVTNTNGCSASGTTSITVNPVPVASISGATTVCTGASATLTASGGSSYVWSSGDSVPVITKSPLATTTYTVTVTNPSGCTATASAVITVSSAGAPNLTVSAPATLTCLVTTDSLKASSTTSGVTYNWGGGNTTSVDVVSAPGSYTVTATNPGNGCIATVTTVVTQSATPPAVTISPATVSLCPGQSATLTASGGGTYGWSTSATTAAITVTPAGTTTYTVTVTGSNGCSATASRVATVNSLPVAVINPAADTICSGQTATLSSGNIQNAYSWSNGATSFSISVNPTSASTYGLTVTNAAGCTASAAATVVVNSVTAGISPSSVTICAGQSTTLTASGGGTYLWSDTAITASISVHPLVTTTYGVTVTGANGCTATASKSVTVNADPVVSISPLSPSTCSGQATTITASGGGTYTWSTGATTAAITVSPVTSTSYGFTVTNASGCSTSNSILVTALPLPASPTVGSNSPVGLGHPIDLTASTVAGVTYQWTGPNGFSSTAQNPVISSATAANGGVYSLVVTGTNGCSGVPVSTSVTINAFTLFMDTVYANPGAQALVLVRVYDFNMMLSAQSSIHFDTSKLQYVQTQNYGVSSLTSGNFGTTQTAAGTLVFTWSDPTLTGVTLPNDSTFFGILFNVKGASGSSTPVIFTGSPTTSEFVDTSFNTINYILNQGEVVVNVNDSVTGKIESELGYGIQLATVVASGSPTYTQVTDTSGKYGFGALPGTSYTITPSKNNDSTVTNGITTLDYLLIQRDILGTAILNTPYKLIAADVNNSGTITSLDLLYIRALILGNITSFPGGRLWAFVPASYTFSNPSNPFPFPTSLTISSVTQLTNQNFIGVKLGDVNDSWNPAVKSVQSTNTVTLETPEMTALPGGEISVPIRASNFKQISGMQFTLQWDPSILKFSSVDSTSGALVVNYGESRTGSGLLSIQWTDPNFASTTIADDSVLFYVAFKVTGQPGETSPMSIGSKMASIEVVDNDLNELNYNINNGHVAITAATAVNNVTGTKDPGVTVMPNPFTEHTQLSFELYNAGDVKIEVYNELGQLVTTYNGNYGVGKHQIMIGESWSSGLYFVRFSTGDYLTTLRIANTVK